MFQVKYFFSPEKEKTLLVTSSIQPNSYHKKKRQLGYNNTTASQGHYYTQSYSIIKKPLEVNQPTFKGFYNFGEKLFLTTIEKVPSSLSEFTFETLEKQSSKQSKIYKKVVEDFISAVTDEKDTSFRKKLKISEDWAKNISTNNLLYLPQKAKARKFLETLLSPVTALFNLYKPLLRGKIGEVIAPSIHKNLLKEKEQQVLISRYKGFLGLNNSIKIWENSYRRFSGNPYWKEGEQFLIPSDVLFKNIQSKRPSVVDPSKGKYSTKSLMLGNRLISGLIAASYLSTDAYNTTMKFSSSKEESNKQQKSRFSQEAARIGLNLYLQNLIFSTFESSMNKSLINALLAAGSTVAISEVVGRQLVSKPIMPSDKKTLDAKEQEMMSKTGFLPALGRLMTRVKKVEKPLTKTTVNPVAAEQKNVLPVIPNKASNPFSSFNSGYLNNKVAFTGREKVAQVFEADHLKKLLNVIEEFDSTQYNYFKEVIGKSLSKGKKQVDLETLMQANSPIEIGEKLTVEAKIKHSVFAPYYWVKGWVKSISKTVKGLSPLAKHEEMLKFVKDNALESDYKEFLNKRMELPVWKNSVLDKTQKEAKILQEFVEDKARIQKEIAGVKNVLLWIDKQVKANKFDLSKLTAEQRKNLETSLEKSMILADSSKHLQYDGNTLAQLNVHFARAITTIFLITDAYNLTMQYSNDNKKAAQGSAKARAVQEGARIATSAYVLGFVHSLLSKVCNSGLAGAFTVAAITSVANDSISRLIVGVPLTPKSKEQLKKHDDKK